MMWLLNPVSSSGSNVSLVSPVMSNVWRRVCRSIRSSKFQVVSIIIICFVILLYTTNDSPTETSEDLRIKINKRQQQNQQLFTRSKTTKNNITSNAKSINPYPFRVVIAPKPCTNEDVVFIVHSAVQVGIFMHILSK